MSSTQAYSYHASSQSNPKTYFSCVTRLIVYALLVQHTFAITEAIKALEGQSDVETVASDTNRSLNWAATCTITTP
jgi:hypothetical protein